MYGTINNGIINAAPINESDIAWRTNIDETIELQERVSRHLGLTRSSPVEQVGLIDRYKAFRDDREVPAYDCETINAALINVRAINACRYAPSPFTYRIDVQNRLEQIGIPESYSRHLGLRRQSDEQEGLVERVSTLGDGDEIPSLDCGSINAKLINEQSVNGCDEPGAWPLALIEKYLIRLRNALSDVINQIGDLLSFLGSLLRSRKH